MNSTLYSTNKRIDFLDSTRGIAALSVIILHINQLLFFELSNKGNNWEYKTLCVFFNGIDAVSYFFVLSGFVLSYKFFTNNFDESPAAFATKRIFRIFPLYTLVVLTAYFLYRSNNSFLLLFKEMSLFSGYNNLVRPGWSLSVEISISLLVPFLVRLVKYDNKTVWQLLIVVVLCYAWITCFVFHFVLGVLLSFVISKTIVPDLLYNKFANDRGKFLLLIVFFGMMYSMRFLVSFSNKGEYLLKVFCDSLKMPLDYLFFYLSAISSFVFILVIFRIEAVRIFLNSKMLVFLGKISFGLYLIHYPIIQITKKYAHLTAETFGNLFVVNLLSYYVIFVSITVLLATIAYYLIEEPFIKLGKKVVAHFDK